MNKKIKVCLTADDFGFTPEISKGILELIDSGLCSATSVMTNFVSPQALKELNTRSLDIGLHFDITSRGYFKKLIFTDFQTEIINQYKSLSNSNLQVRFIDCHHNIHYFPNIRILLQDITKKEGLIYLRSPYELSPFFSFKKSFYNFRFKSSPVAFFGTSKKGSQLTLDLITRLINYYKLNNINKFIWACHPGYTSKSKKIDRLNEDREVELKFFLDNQEWLKERFKFTTLQNILR